MNQTSISMVLGVALHPIDSLNGICTASSGTSELLQVWQRIGGCDGCWIRGSYTTWSHQIKAIRSWSACMDTLHKEYLSAQSNFWLLQATLRKTHWPGSASILTYWIKTVHFSFIFCKMSVPFSWQDIINCGNGEFESLLKMVIWCIHFPEKHFAEVNSLLHTKEELYCFASLTYYRLETIARGITSYQILYLMFGCHFQSTFLHIGNQCVSIFYLFIFSFLIPNVSFL